eukprot:1180749-Amphidinium_carterae.1
MLTTGRPRVQRDYWTMALKPLPPTECSIAFKYCSSAIIWSQSKRTLHEMSQWIMQYVLHTVGACSVVDARIK